MACASNCPSPQGEYNNMHITSPPTSTEASRMSGHQSKTDRGFIIANRLNFHRLPQPNNFCQLIPPRLSHAEAKPARITIVHDSFTAQPSVTTLSRTLYELVL